MVQEANIKRMNAEKRLEDANHKVRLWAFGWLSFQSVILPSCSQHLLLIFSAYIMCRQSNMVFKKKCNRVHLHVVFVLLCVLFVLLCQCSFMCVCHSILCLCCCMYSCVLFCWCSFVCVRHSIFYICVTCCDLDVTISLSEAEQEKARGNNNNLLYVPSKRKEEIKSGTSGCGLFVVGRDVIRLPYFQSYSSVPDVNVWWKLQVGSKEQQMSHSQRFLILFLLFFWMVHTRDCCYSLAPSLALSHSDL